MRHTSSPTASAESQSSVSLCTAWPCVSCGTDIQLRAGAENNNEDPAQILIVYRRRSSYIEHPCDPRSHRRLFRLRRVLKGSCCTSSLFCGEYMCMSVPCVSQFTRCF